MNYQFIIKNAGIHKSMHLRNIGIVYTNEAVIHTAFVSNL